MPYLPILMLLASLPRRAADAIRLVGLALIGLTVLNGSPAPGTGGRGLVVSVLFAAAAVSWLMWTIRPLSDQVTFDLYVMAAAGGLLVEAAPHSAASAFVFVAVVSAGLRVELAKAAPVALVGTLALAVSDLLYNGSALGLLAYTLGLAASLLAAANARGRMERVEQAELLLAQTQRSHEEQLRAARAGGVDPDRAGDPRRAGAHARRADDPARGDGALLDQGADAAAIKTRRTTPRRWRERGCVRPVARSERCAVSRSRPRAGHRGARRGIPGRWRGRRAQD